MKILITGGTGFIGKNVLEQLKDKFVCLAPLGSELNLLKEDEVAIYLKNNHFDVVLHTATWNASRNSKKDLSKVLSNNLRMFFNIARRSDYYGKMIYYGSGAEYDRAHWIPKMKEEYFDTYVPEDDYGFSKYIMCKYTISSKNIYNLRLFGVFGKYEDWEIRFISNACCKAIYDLPITIKKNVFFDYMCIDDLVKISEWFMSHDTKEKIYNVCTGKTVDLLTLARKVLSISNKKLKIITRENGLDKEYSGDNSKLLKEINGYNFKDIDDSISALYKWYLNKKSDIDKDLLLFDK
jgi:GDP-L-fucose synthase